EINFFRNGIGRDDGGLDFGQGKGFKSRVLQARGNRHSLADFIMIAIGLHVTAAAALLRTPLNEKPDGLDPELVEEFSLSSRAAPAPSSVETQIERVSRAEAAGRDEGPRSVRIAKGRV